MYLTQINMIRGLTKAEYFQLRELCFFSNCLYNLALYNVRQHYFKSKRKPSGDRVEAAVAPPAGIAPVNFRRSSKLIESITLKRNNRVNDFIKKTARHIVNFCIVNDIGSIVVGHNPNFKRNINLGKVVNQQFTQIPFGALRRQLKTLCARHGMNFVEQEESFTSKASFLDGDEIPIYDAATPHTGTFSGKRIKRGLYRSSSGRLINADVNGAANILRKSKQKFNFERLCRGLLDSPLRIRVA